MWNVLARQAAKRMGGTIAANNMAGVDEANAPEAYADRIKRDFHLPDYADAWALYDSDRAYWQNYYHPRSNRPAWSSEFLRDSAATAGVPSRNNVFEYGFPESSSAQEVPSVRIPSVPTWRGEFVRDSVAAAGVPGRNNVFEHGFPESNPVMPPIGEAPPQMRSRGSLASPDVFTNGAAPIPFLPLAAQRVPRGLPAMLAEVGAFDTSNPEAPLSGGLPGLIREYLRNH